MQTTYLCVRRVSGITFIGYAKGQKIGKPNNLKVYKGMKTKGINKIVKTE
jgi:hypothetical protein